MNWFFSPLSPLQAATNYKARLDKNLLKHRPEAKNYDLDRKDIVFHTPWLELTGTESWWTKSATSGRQELRLKLRFNYAVQNGAAGFIKILSKNNPLEFRQIPSQDNREIVLALQTPLEISENEIPVSIQIGKEIKIENSNVSPPAPLVRDIALPSPLKLEIAEIVTGFANNRGFVRVITTQELTDERTGPAGFVIEPSVDVSTEKNENGFTIKGDFTETETYTLRLTKQLKGVLGSSLQEEVTKDLFFGKMPAGISFSNKKAIYLTPQGSKNIGVQIVNVPEVQVKILKLYKNNILHYLQNNRYENYAEIGDSWLPNGTFSYNDDPEALYSDVVVNKTVETENLAKNKGVSALNIALPDHNDRQGIYLVSVHSKEQAWLGETRVVSVSDIGLLAKQGKDELWVFANSIKTTEPLSDVEITLISSNNQTLVSARTDAKGVARFEKLEEKAPGFRIAMLTAGKEKDFNYLLLKDTRVETSRFEVDGLRDNTSGLQAFIYGERDIYRPGETAYFNTVIRTSDWKTAGDIPLKLRMVTPNGRAYRTWRKKTNKQGAVAIDASFDVSVLTGSYIFEVYNANDVLLAAQTIHVEEFIPDRIKVDLAQEKPAYHTGETVHLTATATNLFGPPASNRNYEMEMQLKRKKFTAPGFPEFIFDITADTHFEKVQRHGVTNEKGQASEKFPLSGQFKDVGVLEGKVYVTVFDENGRPVNRLQRFDVFTQPVFYGARVADSYVGVNAPVPVEIIGTDRNGKLKPGTRARVEVVRIEYQTIVEKQGAQLRYTSKRKEKSVYTNLLTLSNGKSSFNYIPTASCFDNTRGRGFEEG